MLKSVIDKYYAENEYPDHFSYEGMGHQFNCCEHVDNINDESNCSFTHGTKRVYGREFYLYCTYFLCKKCYIKRFMFYHKNGNGGPTTRSEGYYFMHNMEEIDDAELEKIMQNSSILKHYRCGNTYRYKLNGKIYESHFFPNEKSEYLWNFENLDKSHDKLDVHPICDRCKEIKYKFVKCHAHCPYKINGHVNIICLQCYAKSSKCDVCKYEIH